MSLPFLRPLPDGVEVAVLAQPRASRSRLVGEHDGRLKVQLAAPPVDGEANEALLELFSDVLEVPRRQLAIHSGQTGRRKAVKIAGIELPEVERRLRKALG